MNLLRHNKPIALVDKQILILTICQLLFACSATRTNTSDTIPEPPVLTNDENILFINFEIFHRRDIGRDSVIIRNWKMVPGSMKEVKEADKPVIGDLVIQFKDKDAGVVKEVRIVDPLVVHLEHFDPDGEIDATHLDMDTAQFFVRINYDVSIAFVSISKIMGEESSKQIYHSKLILK